MARFLVWSDLHDEFWGGFDLPDLSAPVDGVLIAGDTHTLGRHLDIPAQAARKYGCPVVVIWGNHEPYGSIWSELLADETRQFEVLRDEGLDIRVLHGAVTEIAGVRIIGATLWTNLKLYPPFEYLARMMVSAYVQDKAAIFDALKEPHEGPSVVMTHHLPVRQLIAPWRMIGGEDKRAMNNGFACDLWDEIRSYDIHTWVWGHSHEGDSWSGEGEHGDIRFITNQRGYPGEGPCFDAAFMLKV